jgi:putative sterol carrier protein
LGGLNVLCEEFPVKRAVKKSGVGHNPFEAEGFKVPSTTHKCCCVAVRVGETSVEVRDTKNPDSPTLSFNKREWQTFIKGVKDNEFDA